MKSFQHGGDITAFAKQCGCRPSEVIDLSSNINFVKPRIGIDFNTLNIAPYPDYSVLQERIADHYDVHMDQVELYNGGSSAIFSLFRHLKGRYTGLPLRCTIYAPAYLEYKKAAEVFGYETDMIDRFENLLAEVAPNSLVVFVNPATPDGRYYDIQVLLEYWHRQHCTVLIDESFLEFTPYPSATALLARYPNLYVLKSMTKFYGAAGIRIGALISQRHHIEALKRTEPVWKLSAFDSTYIQAALQDKNFKERSDKANAQSKSYLLDILDQCSYVAKIYPSDANFILVKLQHINAYALQEKLITYRILIRNCENFDTLDASYVRIAVKSIEALSRLEEALDG